MAKKKTKPIKNPAMPQGRAGQVEPTSMVYLSPDVLRFLALAVTSCNIINQPAKLACYEALKIMKG